MTIDLPSDLQKIEDFIRSRIENFDIDTNASPSEASESVHQVLLGYEFEQSGWFCVVFDTRPDASLDGEWTQVIEETKLSLSHWGDAFWNADEEPFEVVLPDGTNIASEEMDLEEFSTALGQALQKMLNQIRAENSLSHLPLASDCTYAIEDFNGSYGWTSSEQE